MTRHVHPCLSIHAHCIVYIYARPYNDTHYVVCIHTHSSYSPTPSCPLSYFTQRTSYILLTHITRILHLPTRAKRPHISYRMHLASLTHTCLACHYPMCLTSLTICFLHLSPTCTSRALPDVPHISHCMRLASLTLTCLALLTHSRLTHTRPLPIYMLSCPLPFDMHSRALAINIHSCSLLSDLHSCPLPVDVHPCLLSVQCVPTSTTHQCASMSLTRPMCTHVRYPSDVHPHLLPSDMRSRPLPSNMCSSLHHVPLLSSTYNIPSPTSSYIHISHPLNVRLCPLP